jgi:hypothetical protein
MLGSRVMRISCGIRELLLVRRSIVDEICLVQPVDSCSGPQVGSTTTDSRLAMTIQSEFLLYSTIVT